MQGGEEQCVEMELHADISSKSKCGSIPHKWTSIGNFSARDDHTIYIRKLFDKIGLKRIKNYTRNLLTLLFTRA